MYLAPYGYIIHISIDVTQKSGKALRKLRESPN